jgi:hypothetical protein
MALRKSLLLASFALALLAIGGCQSSNTSSQPPSGKGTTVPPAPAPAPTPTPTPTQAPTAGPLPSSSSSPASPSGSAEPQPSTNPAGGAQTPDERRAAIDRRLNDSLGTFDEELKKEQERVAKERDAREATAASSATPDPDDTAKDGEGDAEAGSADTESPPVAGTEKKSGDRPARPGDLKSDKDRDTSSGAASGSGAGAKNIPDGSDDDIVARRLRKAAEQETDPELKEKLWKEYIEYKKNAGQ